MSAPARAPRVPAAAERASSPRPLGRLLQRVRGPHSTRSDAALALDVASVVAFVALWAMAGAAWKGAAAPALLAGALALPLGIAIADFLTGVVHWFADTFFEEDTPVIGPALIYAFREHHSDPRGMERHGFFENSGNNALACCAPLAAAIALGPGASLAGHALHALVLWACLAMFATNQLHKWAHARRAPALVRSLQRRGVILSPKAHAVHHARDHRRGYCVTVGWLNAPLDRIGFFARLEDAVRALAPARASR